MLRDEESDALRLVVSVVERSSVLDPVVLLLWVDVVVLVSVRVPVGVADRSDLVVLPDADSVTDTERVEDSERERLEVPAVFDTEREDDALPVALKLLDRVKDVVIEIELDFDFDASGVNDEEIERDIDADPERVSDFRVVLFDALFELESDTVAEKTTDEDLLVDSGVRVTVRDSVRVPRDAEALAVIEILLVSVALCDAETPAVADRDLVWDFVRVLDDVSVEVGLSENDSVSLGDLLRVCDGVAVSRSGGAHVEAARTSTRWAVEHPATQALEPSMPMMKVFAAKLVKAASHTLAHAAVSDRVM